MRPEKVNPMNNLDPETRRNLHYAALPGKAANSVVVLLLCLVAGLFGVAVLTYLAGAIIPNFLGGF
jgi:hypothetical protein